MLWLFAKLPVDYWDSANGFLWNCRPIDGGFNECVGVHQSETET